MLTSDMKNERGRYKVVTGGPIAIKLIICILNWFGFGACNNAETFHVTIQEVGD